MSVAGYAQQIDVNSLHYSTRLKSTREQQTRLMFDVSSSPKHRVFVLDKPSRLVIDIKNASLSGSLSQPSASHPLFSKVRAAPKNESDLRIVVDLKKPVDSKNFSLSSNNKDGHRLVVDLLNKGTIASAKTEDKAAVKLVSAKEAERPADETKKSAKEAKSSADEAKKTAHKAVKPIALADNRTNSKPVELKPVANKIKPADTKTSARRSKDLIVAIDAGHGGDDPGAHGPQGTEEKIVTFAIAKKLAALINAQPGMKAVMVRKGDYYVGLRKRMQIARSEKADLFISIHADAFENTEVRGASVYTLSTSGATSEAARWLEKSENSVDLVDGPSLDDKDVELASVLLDLSQSATQEASVNLAGHVLKNFQSIGELHGASVQKAGFLVLKSPDIPSILVETAFISNPSEEQNLLNNRYQSKMANAIFKGVYNYFKQSAPVDSRMAAL